MLLHVAVARHLRRCTQMKVAIIDLTTVDPLAHRIIGLIRHTESDTMGIRQGSVQFRSNRSTRPQIDLERLLLHALSERERNGFRIT